MGSTPSPRTSRGRRVALVAGAALVLAGTAGCASDTDLGRLGYPEPVTEQGPILLSFWQNTWIAAFVVGVLTWGLIFWAIIAYRKKANQGAPIQTRYNVPLEILYTVAPAIMIAALFVPTSATRPRSPSSPPTRRTPSGVVGLQVELGLQLRRRTAPTTPAPRPGRPSCGCRSTSRSASTLTSPDVIHSFWVPQFLFKMDVIPGRDNQFELTPNKIGVFAGKCAELCGTDHSRMLFNVNVVTRAEYDAHIAALKANGQDGRLETGRDHHGRRWPRSTLLQTTDR